MGASKLYDRDFYAWANEQAGLLRAGRLAEADVMNLAEEIETMGRSERRELINRLAVLLLHLAKWRWQPSLQSTSWRTTISNQRLQLRDHLDDNPSLRAELEPALERAWERARNDAEEHTGLPLETFPAVCPWAFQQVMSGSYLPVTAQGSGRDSE